MHDLVIIILENMVAENHFLKYLAMRIATGQSQPTPILNPQGVLYYTLIVCFPGPSHSSRVTALV